MAAGSQPNRPILSLSLIHFPNRSHSVVVEENDQLNGIPFPLFVCLCTVYTHTHHFTVTRSGRERKREKRSPKLLRRSIPGEETRGKISEQPERESSVSGNPRRESKNVAAAVAAESTEFSKFPPLLFSTPLLLSISG